MQIISKGVIEVILKNDWQEIIGAEFEKEYYLKMREYLKKEYKQAIIYPDMQDIYNALNYTPYHLVKVVILGQDPYHGEKQAHGLSFSVKPGVGKPPSLVNIFKELQDDLQIEIPNHGCLKEWAEQGVLLLNATLTVRAETPNSHQGIGWGIFTDEVIRKLNQRKEPIVFILWGSFARNKKILITNPDHLILEAPHPSPLSSYRGFFGSKPFSKANEFLMRKDYAPIDWQIHNL